MANLYRLLCLVGMLTFTAKLCAQAMPDYRRLATDYFNSKQYFAAAEYYKKALGIDQENQPLQRPYYTAGTRTPKAVKNSKDSELFLYYQLAESYRLYNDFQHAQPIYEKFQDGKDSVYPLARLWLGVCYRANGNPEKGKIEIEHFLKTYDHNDEYKKTAQLELASCNFTIDQKKYPVTILLNKLGEPLNSAGSNYRLQWISNNDVQFTSSRPVKVSATEFEYPSRVLQGPYGGSFSPLFSDKNIETAASIVSADGLTMYVTGWKKNAGKNKVYGIYQSVRSSTSVHWPEPVLLPEPVNVPPFNSKEPFITADGRFLVFASDRPGGLGLYDLYWVKISGHDLIGKAVNMGKTINTPLQDESPFYDAQTRELFFSSNGRVGLGGLDIYRTVGEFANNNWEEPLNMGISVNSIKDDLYYTRYNNRSYISSDRQSLCCLELFEIKPLHATFTVKLIDCETQQPIRSERSSILVYDSTEKVLQASKDVSGINGYAFMLGSVGAMQVIGAAKGYDTAKAIWRVNMAEEGDSSSILRLCLKKKTNYLENAYKQFSSTLPKLPVSYDGREITIQYFSNRLFEKDKYKLSPAGRKALDSILPILKSYPELKFKLTGYVDYADSAGYNDYVSWEMASYANDYLVSKGLDVRSTEGPKVENVRASSLGPKGIPPYRRRVVITIRNKFEEN